jgi:hypothetical protein
MRIVVLSVDPGKATGMCLLSLGEGAAEPELEWSGEYQPQEFAAPIRNTLEEVAADGGEVSFRVVCERFTINAQTVRNSQAPYSLEQIGVLKQILRDYGYSDGDIVFQSPSDAKRMFDNPALKKLDYWHKGGEGHALDAIRHGLLYLAKNGWTPKRLLQGY